MIRPLSPYTYLRRIPLSKLLLLAAILVAGLYLAAFAALVGGSLLRHRRSVRRRMVRHRRVEDLAGQILAALPSPAEVDRALEAVEGPDAEAIVDGALLEARRQAPDAEGLARLLRERGTLGRLLEESAAEETWRRVLALDSLRTARLPESLAAFQRLSVDPAPEARRAGREGLLSTGTPEAVRLLLESLLGEFPIRADWRGGLFERIPGSSAPALLEILRDEALDARQEKLALELLGDAGEPLAAPLAMARVGATDPERRATAARVLGKLGVQPAAVAALLSDREWWVRAAAARAFESMGAEAGGLAALEARLSDGEWWVRSNAARALACQGQAGLAALFSVLEDEDSEKDARDAAHSALASADLPSSARVRLEALVRRRTTGLGTGSRRDERRRPRGAA